MTNSKPIAAPLAVACSLGLAFGLSLTTGGCAERHSAAPATGTTADDRPLAGREAVLTIFGMSCPLCANNVDKTLGAVPGISSVHVDMGSGKARITLDGATPVTRRQLAAAVDRSGFTLKGIETP